MDIISIITGILSWVQVGMGQAPITAATIYQGAAVLDKITTEDLRGTWTAEIQEHSIKTVKSFIMRVEDSRTMKGYLIEVEDPRKIQKK
jgi:hypothetical protein